MTNQTIDTTVTADATIEIAPAAPTADPIAVIAEIAALTQMIEMLTPDAKRLAVKIGLIQRSQMPAADRQASKPKGDKPHAAKVTEMRPCACGCGQSTQSAFRPGHDATAKGRMIRAMTGKMTQDELGWRPNAELRSYVASHPDWQARFGGWIAALTAPVTEPVASTDEDASAE